MSMAYVPGPGDAWGPKGRTTPAMRRSAAALALLVLFWASQKVENPYAGGIRAGVASLLATGPTTTTGVLQAVRPLAAFAARQSWGAVMDWWLAAHPRSRPRGEILTTYGWHRRGRGYVFVPGDTVRLSAGTPVRAFAAGVVEVVRRDSGLVVERAPSGTRVVYLHVRAIRVRPGEPVARGSTLAVAGPQPIAVDVVVHGFPANPASYVAQILR